MVGARCYGYAPLDYHRTRGRLTPLQNQYGLYRTANLLEVSETRAEKATTIVSYENLAQRKLRIAVLLVSDFKRECS